MKLLTPFVCAMIIASCLSFSVHAQTDSTRLDAGSLILQKEFTQGIVIKGGDLEKMPFASLADAISAWTYGVYTRSADLVYVVDGNRVSDVNAYSIYDIEEIVLVQNATVLTNTAGSQQQLLLITTRRGKGKSGFRVAGGTHVVTTPGHKTGLYHQYYAGADQHLGKIDLGVSADWLHDLLPMTQGDRIKPTTPYNMDRWRFNAYFVLHAGTKNIIEVHANYSPQTLDSGLTLGTFGSQTNLNYKLFNHQSQNLFTPWARWHSTWLPGLANDLQVGHLAALNKGDFSYTEYPDYPGSTGPSKQNVFLYTHTDHTFIREHLSYRMAAGGWRFEPSFDASLERIRNRTVSNNMYQSGTIVSASSFAQSQSGSIYILIPAIDISYKHALDIQGGVVANVSRNYGYDFAPKRIYPFASLSFDILRMTDPASRSGLKIFGSYAKRSNWGNRDYTENDLANLNNPYIFPTDFFILANSGPVVVGNSPVPKAPGFWMWQVGAGYSALEDRLQINYHFERRNYATSDFDVIPGGGLIDINALWVSSFHYANISGKILDGRKLTWRSGLTATMLRSKTDSNYIVINQQPAGDHFPGDKGSWTGGWVNRLTYGAFGAGVDVVYHFNEGIPHHIAGSNLTFHRQNTLVLQHIYASYKMAVRGAGPLELYVDGRGLLQGARSTLPDQRRYYGVGGKLTI